MGNLNLKFLFVLFLLFTGLVFQAWGFYLAKEVVIENSKYDVDKEMERNFNIWQFERSKNYLFSLAGIVLMIIIIYILLSRRITEGKR